MIIDNILDRMNGGSYNPKEFYNYIAFSPMYGGFNNPICVAMDYGTNKEVQNELINYISSNGYNRSIIDYIKTKNWI